MNKCSLKGGAAQEPLIERVSDFVKSGRITYKAMVVELVKSDPVVVEEVMHKILVQENDPKYIAKLSRNSHRSQKKVEYNGNKERIKSAMKDYNSKHSMKTKRTPAVKGPLTSEEKERRKTAMTRKKVHMAVVRSNLGGPKATVGDLDKAEKEYNEKIKLERKSQKGQSQKGQSQKDKSQKAEEGSDSNEADF